MRFLFLAAVLVICSCSITAQSYIQYHNLVNEAEFWMYKKDYKKAKKLYKKAFRLEKAIPKDSYLLAKCYAALGNAKQCKKWLKISSKTPISYAPYFIKRDDQIDVFKKVFSEEEIEALSKKLKVLKHKTDSIYKDSSYYMIRDSMQLLHDQDQIYRKNITDKNRGDSVYMRLLSENDIVVQTKFLNIIKTYGYPGYHNFGMDKGDLILVHVIGDEKMFKEYEKVLFQELKKGNILPFPYAYMLDRWHLTQTNSCYLFMRIYTQKLCTEEDYEAIIQRRLDIGLSIYFEGPRKKPFEPYELQPWVDHEFIEKYSFLNKNCD